MIYAFLYIQVFFGVVQVIWCNPQDFERHRNWGLLPHDQCGNSNASSTLAPRIREGDDPCNTRLPWIVKLYINDAISGKYSFLCGGTIINNRYILSVAHCVVFYNQRYISVAIGGTCKFSKNLYFKVQSVTIHPKFSTCEDDYSDSFKNDISLIRLEKEIEFKGNIVPICLPFGIDFETFGNSTTMEIAGWRKLLNGILGLDTRQSKNVTVLPKWECSVAGITIKYAEAARTMDKLKFKCLTPLDQTQLCVSGGGNHDTGVPLMKSITVNGKPTYFIFGIRSYFILHFKTIYTAVHVSLKWILDEIKP